MSIEMASHRSNLRNVQKLFGILLILFQCSFQSGVDAIRCHQCNSHTNEDCLSLRLSTPHNPPDNSYLRECPENSPKQGGSAYCRKEIIRVEASSEDRIIRSCGWLRDNWKSDVNDRQPMCYDNDSEGVSMRICVCYEDGCNAATKLMKSHRWIHFLGFGFVIFATLIVTRIR